ncbi:MAG: hypothetical protein DIZ77_03150 [endosymbiont of Seepiophila jonesi]|uniref:Ice-binding protein C-terminal domain-containing protein n=1 Tax=endosymbiont of Lamellibrachia luymesi TaxID=2200907 RepID=A0A370E0L9_9GAMM|nr:MAG: hypothetical protein DIZ79_01855 [endosymbiont of Lamellibrachia luymesi]RDH94067.1 MAG: hypothetical protein DIZ77_03150 [endosymbiont of Seepiophila jonesi]
MSIKKFLAIPFFTLCVGSSASAGIIASSSFDSGMEGWTGAPASEFSWVSSGGNTGGYIQSVDSSASAGGVLAPPTFLGDWSAFNGNGTISFDHKLFSTGYIGNMGIGPYKVEITGAAGSALWQAAPPTGATDWISLTVPIDEADCSVTGVWSDILSSVTELWIKVELVDNDASRNRDITGIDNIVLSANVPEPTSFLLMGLGLAGLGFARRRKKA